MDQLIDKVIISLLLIITLFVIYSLFNSVYTNYQADPKIIEEYKPNLDFDQLKKMNKDVIGWLTIKGTKIDYPFVQGKDNYEYINKDVKKEFSLAGSLFLDYRNNQDLMNQNNIIYGHHMSHGLMFGNLELYKDQTFFNEHRTGKIYYANKWHHIQFISFIKTNANNSIIYNPSINKEYYKLYLKENSLYYRDFNGNGNLLTLSTCTSQKYDERYVLIGEIID